MLLADVLALASRKVCRPSINEMNALSPCLLVDFATLTGDPHAFTSPCLLLLSACAVNHLIPVTLSWG